MRDRARTASRRELRDRPSSAASSLSFGEPVARAQHAGDDHVLDLLDRLVGDGHAVLPRQTSDVVPRMAGGHRPVSRMGHRFVTWRFLRAPTAGRTRPRTACRARTRGWPWGGRVDAMGGHDAEGAALGRAAPDPFLRPGPCGPADQLLAVEHVLHPGPHVLGVQAADRQRRTAPQHVVDRLGPLVVAGVDDLRPDLRPVGVDALAQRRVLVDQPRDVEGERAVVRGQVARRSAGPSARRARGPPAAGARPRWGWRCRAAACRRGSCETGSMSSASGAPGQLRQLVHHRAADVPVRRPLAARDRQHAAARPR